MKQSQKGSSVSSNRKAKLSSSAKAKLNRQGARAKKRVTTKPLPWNGDHGTGTAAATVGTVIEPIKDNPNRMAVRKRVCVIDTLTSLTLRQHQAAKSIQAAYGRVDMLSSGGELKEQVDSTPKPDATVAVQVDAQSRLAQCTAAILRSDRAIVDHICWYNLPIGQLARMGHVRAISRFAASMDRVADRLGY